MRLVRENGLRAAAYVAVIDLHPQVADAMLEALEAEGVAAYAAPVASNRGLLLPTQFPTGPLDRLFVDRDAYDTAKRVLDEHLSGARDGFEPEPVEMTARTAAGDEPPADFSESIESGRDPVDDETWEKIIATFHGAGLEPPKEGVGPGVPTRAVAAGSSQAWPDAEDLDPDATSEAAPLRATAPAGSGRAQSEDRYVPPPPPPLPVADQTTRLAWAGVIGGPTLFILALLLDWDLASWAQLAGVAALVVGFVTLVARMRDDAPDDDPDNGAVV